MISQKYSFYEIYKIIHNVEWGKHPWIKCNKNDAWSNKIVINTSSRRFMTVEQILLFIEQIKDKIDECVFVAFEIKEWEFFCNKTGLDIPLHLIHNFEELGSIINSCKYAYLSLSSPQAFANALHKEHTCLISSKCNIPEIEKCDLVLASLTHKFPHFKMLPT